MKIKKREITVRELSEGYQDNEEQGVRAFGGKLDVRPPYQREFVYKDKQRDAVIDTLSKSFPLNVMYWSVRHDGDYEIIDGQQRTISICQYVEGDFSLRVFGNKLQRAFYNLQPDEKKRILDYKLDIYLCSGTDSEKLEWFETINIAGEELTKQELRNAVYAGPWVTDAKKHFSKHDCVAHLLAGDYMRGSYIRQDYLETAITWINNGDIEGYMLAHQHDVNANELWLYFQQVIAWVKATFTRKPDKEMKGLEWGRLYERYHSESYDAAELDAEVNRLRGDPAVESNKGIYEYLLSRKGEPQLLSIRLFSDQTKAVAYEQQTKTAEAKGVSNCALCATGGTANKTRIYEPNEMEADHVTAWSKGGNTDLENCEMLCVVHNRAKGNR